MIRRPPRSTQSRSSAASDVYKRQIKNFDTQFKVFEEITVASVLINNPPTAAQEIDRMLNSALSYKRPVYIELPRDIVSVDIFVDDSFNHAAQFDQYQEKSDPIIL